MPLRRLLIALGLASVPALTSAETLEPSFRIASHNVHYIILGRETGSWSVGDWEERKPALNAAFQAMDADIIAFQEMESFARSSFNDVNLARDWLLENNPGYSVAATGDPREFPTTQPIFYRAERFGMLDQGWFFFSDTPDEIYSRTFNGGFAAFASWAQLEDKATGRAVRVINVHTDFSSGTNRLKSMDLVVKRMQPWLDAGERVILLGDFNARTGAQTMQIPEAAGIRFLTPDSSTYHFNIGLNLFGAIDHIGLSDGLTGAEAIALRGRFEGDWPSDHYPIYADVFFTTP